MNVITIPKKLSKKDDLVVMPRKEYEKLLRKQKIVPVAKLSSAGKRALNRGRKELKAGEYISLEKLEHEMEGANRKKR